jgi:hypothetical protein
MSNNILSQVKSGGAANKFRVCPSSKHILSRDTHTLKKWNPTGGDGDALAYISEDLPHSRELFFSKSARPDNATTTNDNPLQHYAAAQSSW